MNDIYKLHQNGAVFTWELIEVAGKNIPGPRSGFSACLASDVKFYLFGGSGENNVKYNDLWEFDGTQWIELNPGCPVGIKEEGASTLPLQKSGHQIQIYKNRHLLLFGGIHEVTYEMNDFKVYDLVKQCWNTIDEENKNASESGSPKNKGMIQ